MTPGDPAVLIQQCAPVSSPADTADTSPRHIRDVLVPSRGPLSGGGGNTGFEATPSLSVTLLLRVIGRLTVDVAAGRMARVEKICPAGRSRVSCIPGLPQESTRYACGSSAKPAAPGRH